MFRSLLRPSSGYHTRIQIICKYISIIVQRDATQNSLCIILQVHSTCFGCQSASLATLEGGSCAKNMTSTGGCSYSFVYSWWWVWLTPETCRVNLQNNKQNALCCISLDSYEYRSAMHGTISIKYTDNCTKRIINVTVNILGTPRSHKMSNYVIVKKR